MKRGKSQKKIQIYPRDKLNSTLSLLCQLLENYETLETIGEVLRTITENMGVQSDTFKSMGFNLSQG